MGRHARVFAKWRFQSRIRRVLMRGVSAVFCACPLLTGQVPGHLVTTDIIDFSDEAAMGYVHRGYRVTAAGSGFVTISAGGGIRATNGGRYLAVGTTGAPVTLAHADGLPFQLISLDLAEYSTVAVPGPVNFEGIKSDGSRVTLRFEVDGVIDGDGPAVDFQTISFPAAWSDIVSLQVLDGKVALDQITVRGLGLDGFHAALPQTAPLEVLGVVESSVAFDSWGVMSLQDGKLRLRRQRFSSDPEYFFGFDPVAGGLEFAGSYSVTGGQNPDTSEQAIVSNGVLIWRLGANTVELARVGQDGVIGIKYPKPAAGRVLFLNEGNENHGNPSVLIAGPECIEPVLTCETMLPDGGLPRSIAGKPAFTCTSLAIEVSTTRSTRRHVLSFAGGPLRLSPGDGDSIPGTNLKISGWPVLRWLNDAAAGFLANSSGGNGELLQIVMTADGGWTATVRPVPAFGTRVTLPGAGSVLRSQSVALFDHDSAWLGYGPVECSDLAPNNVYGFAAEAADGRRSLLLRQGQQIPGFGEIASFGQQALIQDGWFFATVRDPQGVLAIVRGRFPAEEPALKAGAFVPTSDGTLRFMVEHLTHGRRYRVERADDPAGPWERFAGFTAGSAARSVLGDFSPANRRFFRVAEGE